MAPLRGEHLFRQTLEGEIHSRVPAPVTQPKMPALRRLTSREPLWFFALLWPLVLLAPILPPLPKGAISSLPWRQELFLASLLTAALFLLLKRTRNTETWERFSQRELYLLLPLFSFIALACFSLLWANSRIHAAHYLFTWLSYLICFLLMRQIAGRPSLLRLSLISLALVLSVIGVATTIEFWTTEPAVYNSGLMLRRSTGLGEPFAVAVPIFVVLALRLRNVRMAFLSGLTAVLAWLAMLQSLERAPFLGLMAGLLLLVAGMLWKTSWRPRLWTRAVLLACALVAATAIQSLAGTSSVTRFQDLKRTDANTQVRFLVWAIGLEMFRDNPLLGVGANNYELAYPSAREQFSASYPASPLVSSHEELLAQRAHNEYIQILAELGAIGFILFLLFCVSLIWLAVRALRSARNPLALGAVCSLMTFAISSGASSVSFRWLGSGLLFFFASALVLRFATTHSNQRQCLNSNSWFGRPAAISALIVLLLITGAAGSLGLNSILRGMALQRAREELPTSEGASDSESLFRAALTCNPYDGPTHFDYGSWLYSRRRYPEATRHLRLATERGFNSSTCYAFLAAAEAAAGEMAAAERTLRRALRVYPQSVFLRVRHAIALAETGRSEEAKQAYNTALSLHSRDARGWRNLMCFGPDSAHVAAQKDTGITAPKDLQPASWAFPAIAEQANRPPSAYPPDPEAN